MSAETKNWFKRGVIPTVAAEGRRRMAEQFPNGAAQHLKFAGEWERIIEDERELVIEAMQRELQEAIKCLAFQEPGSNLAKYWGAQADHWDREILKLNPEHEA